jgi:transposase
MKEYISFDSHKHYTLAERENRKTRAVKQCRIAHQPGAIRHYLEVFAEPGTPVAVETVGNWYWIVDEIEQAGMIPLLVHARKAKLMMGMINKTDKLDVHGLNVLQRAGTLPTVWIPPRALRDLRELTRARLALVQQRTKLKNRITSTLDRYGLRVEGATDLYGKKARPQLLARLAELPPHTQTATTELLAHMEATDHCVREMERRIQVLVRQTPSMALLKTLPGIGDILAATIELEIGESERFASAERFASYAGLTPRVHASGDKTRIGRLRPDVNRYLRWSFVEAGNSLALNARRLPERHVSQLYQRLRQRRGHSKAIGAVARHLAEAAYHVLTRGEPYRDPALSQRSS